MENRWRTILAVLALAAGLTAGRAHADPLPDVGVLDRLAVPPVVIGDRSEGRPADQLAPADAVVAVPTPSAAGFGLVGMACLIVWRTGRRVIGHA